MFGRESTNANISSPYSMLYLNLCTILFICPAASVSAPRSLARTFEFSDAGGSTARSATTGSTARSATTGSTRSLSWQSGAEGSLRRISRTTGRLPVTSRLRYSLGDTRTGRTAERHRTGRSKKWEKYDEGWSGIADEFMKPIASVDEEDEGDDEDKRSGTGKRGPSRRRRNDEKHEGDEREDDEEEEKEEEPKFLLQTTETPFPKPRPRR